MQATTERKGRFLLTLRGRIFSMGDKGGGGDAGQAAEKMAKQLFKQTDPFRQSLYGNWANFLGMPTGGPTAQGGGSNKSQDFGVIGGPWSGFRNVGDDRFARDETRMTSIGTPGAGAGPRPRPGAPCAPGAPPAGGLSCPRGDCCN